MGRVRPTACSLLFAAALAVGLAFFSGSVLGEEPSGSPGVSQAPNTQRASSEGIGVENPSMPNLSSEEIGEATWKDMPEEDDEDDEELMQRVREFRSKKKKAEGSRKRPISKPSSHKRSFSDGAAYKAEDRSGAQNSSIQIDWAPEAEEGEGTQEHVHGRTIGKGEDLPAEAAESLGRMEDEIGVKSEAYKQNGEDQLTEEGRMDTPPEEPMDELKRERLQFEAAQRAVQEMEERQAALEFARKEKIAAEALAKEEAKRARADALKQFNEQDLARRSMSKDKPGGTRISQYAHACPSCHTVIIGARGRTARGIIEKLLSIGENVLVMARMEKKGVIVRPKWFSEMSNKASFRGIQMRWAPCDVTEPKSLQVAFKGAKAVVFAITANGGKKVGDAFRRDYADSPKQVDYLGVKNVAEAAVQQGVPRFILLSSIGVSRPYRLANFFRLPFASIVNRLYYFKRMGEMAAMKACGHPNSTTSYTIVRAGDMGQSSWTGAHQIIPNNFEVTQGDYRQGNTTRSTLAAVAAEAIFEEKAKNTVFEVISKPEVFERAVSKDRRRSSGTAEGEKGKDEKVLAWQEAFSALRPSAGHYKTLKDQEYEKASLDHLANMAEMERRNGKKSLALSEL